MPDEQILDTPVGSEDSQDAATPQQGDGTQQQAPRQEEYFLDADERHRYKTREEAIAAIKQSGERIGQLTPWQEHAQRYGITDPNALPNVFDRYLEMKQKLAEYERQAAQNTQQSQGTQQKLDPKDEANVKYLETHGFTRKEAVDKVLQERLSPLEQKIARLEAQLGESSVAQTNAVIESGRNYLGELMSDAGYAIDNPDTNEVIEDAIVAWMEGKSLDRNNNIVPGTPLDRFYQGGAAMKEVVKEGFERVTRLANLTKINADATVQRSRQQNVSRTPRALPRQGAPVPQKQDETPSRPRTPGSGGVFADPSLHDKAWERMQEVNNQ